MKKTVSLLFTICIVVCAALLWFSCDNLYGLIRRPVIAADIIIDPDTEYQTMRGFGASDAWCGNFVGRDWEASEREKVARWLFSKEADDDGNPMGIGLSMWRFYLGAGSAEQGDASGIGTGAYKNKMVTRRAECFLDNNTGSYNWNQHAGQQYFLRKARDYGVESFVAFTIAPPIRYSRNGKAYANGDGKANVKADNFDDYAVYLAEVIKHFKDTEGITFNYLSPVNEPQYSWKTSEQEGTPFHNSEIKTFTVEIDMALLERGLTGTKIILAEAANWSYLYGGSGNSANQIDAFFNPSSANYVGNLPSVARIISGHSYFSYKNNTTLKDNRERVRVKADQFGLEVFQTEWSLLDDSIEGIPPNADNADYIDSALAMAKVIYSDLVFTGVTSWSFWTAMDAEHWGHKDRFLLVALAPGVKEFEKDTIDKYPMTQSGVAKDYQTLWALGNYSLFVRPGFKRIAIEGEVNNLNGLMATAFVSPSNERIVTVYVNMGTSSLELAAGFADGRTPAGIKCYVTDVTNNLSLASEGSESFLIPARSIYTVVYDF